MSAHAEKWPAPELQTYVSPTTIFNLRYLLSLFVLCLRVTSFGLYERHEREEWEGTANGRANRRDARRDARDQGTLTRPSDDSNCTGEP